MDSMYKIKGTCLLSEFGSRLKLETYISFLDILIRDYFTKKTLAGMIDAMSKNPINKKVPSIVKIVCNCMENPVKQSLLMENYNTICYNLDMIISLGYRVKSKIATNFRHRATERFKTQIG